jgi:hypothetical protein
MSSTGRSSVGWEDKYDHLRLRISEKKLIIVGISINRDGSITETILASFWPKDHEVAKRFLMRLIGKTHREGDKL